METFTRGEVAWILQMPEAKVKNWTIGRPLKLSPSIRTAKGTGSRNLYNIEDLYTMAVANELSKGGMALELVGLVIEKVKSEIKAMREKHHDNTHIHLGYEITFGYVDHIIVELLKLKLTIKMTGRRIRPEGIVLTDKYDRSRLVEVRYTIPVERIRGSVDWRVSQIS